MTISRMRKTIAESIPRIEQPRARMPSPPAQIQLAPAPFLGEKKQSTGAPPIAVVNKPNVYIEPCYSKRINTYQNFRGAIFVAQGGQIPNYAGTVSILIQNNSGFNIFLADSFDLAKAALTPPRGFRLSDGESLAMDIADGEAFYADNLASAATCRVDVIQLLKAK